MTTNFFLQTTTISRNIIRNYVRRSKNANPGIQKRLNIVNDQNLDDVDVEELESDFMNVGEVHRDHEKELKQFREKEKFWIVKQRYFKENKINFLTWSDKEQIQFLHQANPEEWTVEHLVESFPAFSDTINKIVKMKWNAKNETKKLNHDKSVEKNWKLLREGKLSGVISQDLLNHVSKFSSRSRTQSQNFENPVGKIVSKNKISEFSSIISDFKSKKSEPNVEISENINEYCEKTDKIDGKLKNYGKKAVTLSMVKHDNKMADEHNTDRVDSKMLDENKTDFDIKLPEIVKNESKSVYFGQKSNTNVINYPERIKIPKDKYKKNSTYKLNDCYYDSDGEFLYRVPGMY